MAEKNKFWVGICYPENMVEGWKEKIYDLVQVPFCYCVHDIDRDTKSDERKDHVHIILAFNNTTTKNWAYTVMDKLSAPGRKCCPGVQAVIWIRNKYDYLIHDTEGARKAGKELYPPEERICGNGFDIGLYEQVSQQDKEEAFKELSSLIIESSIENYADFFMIVLNGSDYEEPKYMDTLRSYSSHFERLCKGIYLKRHPNNGGKK